MSQPASHPLSAAPPAKLGQDRPRLAVVDELTLTTPLDPYLSLRALATYSGCSVHWLRDRLTDPAHPLPCFWLPGGKVLVRKSGKRVVRRGSKVLVRRSEFDAWISAYRRTGRPDVEQIVDEILREL